MYSKKRINEIDDEFLQYRKEYKNCMEENKKPGFILTTGSFCPIHNGHIYSLIDAKNFMENTFQFKILGILISPSNDLYVKNKAISKQFEKYFLTFKQRCALIEKTIEIICDKEKINKELFHIHKWEGENEQFIDFPTVWSDLNNVCKKNYKKAEFFYALGSDMISQTRIDIFPPNGMPLIVTEREMNKNERIKIYASWYEDKKYIEMEKKNLFYLKPSKEYWDFSSTALRKYIETGKEDNILNKLIFKEVIDMIKKYYE